MLTVQSPVRYMAFQATAGVGDIVITGSVANTAGTVEARFNGGSWAVVASSVLGAFSGTLAAQTAATGTLEVRFAGSPSHTSVLDIEVGDALNLLSTKTLITGSAPDVWVGRPVLVDVGGGLWAMIYRAAPDHAGTDSKFHIRFSDDEGVTWTADDIYIDAGAVTGAPFEPHYGAGSTNVPDAILILAPNGDLLCHIHELFGVGTYQYRSTAASAGKIWTDEGRINSDIEFWGAEDHVVIGSDIYATARYDALGDQAHPHRAQLWKSTNNGSTWAQVGSNIDPADVNEVGLGNPSANKLVVVVRNPQNNGSAWSRTSTDLGANWGANTDIGAMVASLHRPRMRKFGSNLYLFGRDYNDGAERTVVYLSSNDGVTWRKRFFPSGLTTYDDTGYCDMLQRASGDFYMLSYIGTTSAATVVEYVFRLGT